MVAVGLTLHPDEEFLGRLEAVLLEEPDYYELAPETLWRSDGAGQLSCNPYHASFLDLGARTGRPFVAHGVSFSLGTVDPPANRRRAFFKQLQETQQAFDFRWYSDHLGTTFAGGTELTLPLPLPPTPAAARVLQRNMQALQSLVPDVGVENSVFYFHFGDPLEEVELLRRATCGDGLHLLLDLHNLYTTACNVGFEPGDMLRRLPLDKVIEIHLSGGSVQPAAWPVELGPALRVDSHDDAVPEEVWQLFEAVLLCCTNLRGVTLERMEGTLDDGDEAVVREELRRIRRTLEAGRVAS